MDKNINLIVKKIGKMFKEKNLSLVTAESCTGGGLAYFISNFPEASSILERGFITYSNPAKEKVLEVTKESLHTKGAVSKEVSIEMAIGALKNSQAQVSIAITGLAGPDRENVRNKNNASGIVWITCRDVYQNQICKKKEIKGNRKVFIKKVIFESLIILLEYVQKFSTK